MKLTITMLKRTDNQIVSETTIDFETMGELLKELSELDKDMRKKYHKFMYLIEE